MAASLTEAQQREYARIRQRYGEASVEFGVMPGEVHVWIESKKGWLLLTMAEDGRVIDVERRRVRGSLV